MLPFPLNTGRGIPYETIGMQNSCLAKRIAVTAFPDPVMAAVPGAIFSVWHNSSGAGPSNLFVRMENDDDLSEKL